MSRTYARQQIVIVSCVPIACLPVWVSVMEITSFRASFGREISLFVSRTGPSALHHVKMAYTSTQEQGNVYQLWKRVSVPVM